jgi:hypothetical protein
MQFISAALCLVMLTTVVAGVVTAKQDVKSNQAGKSSIYLYNVVSTDNSGSGKLIIDLDKHTFVFTGRGFEPSEKYSLFYTIGDTPGMHKFASVVATQSGHVFLRGIWVHDITSFAAAPTFSITPPIAQGASLYAELHWGYVPTPVYLGGVKYTPFNFWAGGSTMGVGVGYQLIVDQTYGGSEQLQIVYDGPSCKLTDNIYRSYSDDVLIRDGAQASATLIVYDLAGNSVEASYPDIINVAG